MNPATPRSKGSTIEIYLDLVAAPDTSGPAAVHWACGMPLSYVQEMAEHWLNQHDERARLRLPAEESSRSDKSMNAATK